jgi:hypothetical protein
VNPSEPLLVSSQATTVNPSEPLLVPSQATTVNPSEPLLVSSQATTVNPFFIPKKNWNLRYFSGIAFGNSIEF